MLLVVAPQPGRHEGMKQEDKQGVCAVVMEAGAEWPTFDHDARGADSYAVIPQQPEETPAELAWRAAERVASLERNGARVESVVSAVGSAHDDEVFAARCVVARALIAQNDGRGEAELIFSASARLTEAARHELLALAGTLAAQARGSALSVKVRFRADSGEQRGASAAGRAREIAPVVA